MASPGNRLFRDRTGQRPSRSAVVGSLCAHGVVGAAFLVGAEALRPLEIPPSVRVRMVAAAPEDAPIRTDAVQPEVREEENRPPPPEPTPDPLPQTETPAVEEEVVPDPEPEEEPARTEEEGEEIVDVQIEGANSLFPQYNRNIIRQINRYWRPPAGARDLRAEIAFVIHRDGSVTDLEWIARSRSRPFNLVAMGAIESAARAGAFGPLPAAFPADAMRVSFFFDPSER